ncbi:amino acid ABC transporter substrate-binding protein [Roseomonas eburnea]|uniref:Amino acid ABC transporter substrate-binding protein n=1 Tax=Neoroseomonas eburnea TaxID=1346889 RepID=A0A9X9X798_9PROT|nr:amino acid ABC transporter substrate-binding protein [Neoroseomonas eburnea]MBR0679584.1 amino acid ABC transporter substrate-binding protein [Neoroseomonas eburnea]
MRRFFTLVAAAIGLAVAAPAAEAGPVLDRIRANNTLRCGVGGSLAGFSLPDSRGEWRGLDVDYCRALAAAVLGDPRRVTFVPVTLQTRFTALSSGEVDVLARDTVMTFSRDVNLGIVFVGVNFYTGTGVMVRRASGVTRMEQLDGATICASQGGSNLPEVGDFLRARNKPFTPLTFDRFAIVLEAFFAGRCDAVTAGAADLAAAVSVQVPNPQDFLVLPEVLSRDPYGPSVARGDMEWFSIARWTLAALVEAEERGVTRANARDQARTATDPALKRLLGTEDNLGGMLGLPRDWVVRVIEAVGNYGEIYDRNFGPETPINLHRGQNNVVSRGGLHYGLPFR